MVVIGSENSSKLSPSLSMDLRFTFICKSKDFFLLYMRTYVLMPRATTAA